MSNGRGLFMAYMSLLLVGCLGVPDGGQGEKMLASQMQTLNELPRPEATAPLPFCPVTQADLSSMHQGEVSPRPPRYFCFTPARANAQKDEGGVAREESRVKSRVGAERFALLQPPCPPNRYQYIVESGDSLESLSHSAVLPGTDWRVWAGVAHLRNTACFSDQRELKVGCTLLLPDIDVDRRLQPEWFAYWSNEVRPAADSPLSGCAHLWAQEAG